jgi:hypothetical protein
MAGHSTLVVVRLEVEASVERRPRLGVFNRPPHFFARKASLIGRG